MAFGAALVIATAGCGGGSGGGAGGSAENQSITIGIKYDQPGLGEGGRLQRFRRRRQVRGQGTELAGEARCWRPPAQRETPIRGASGYVIFAAYWIDDAPAEQKVSFGGPYFIAGQALWCKPTTQISRVRMP